MWWANSARDIRDRVRKSSTDFDIVFTGVSIARTRGMSGHGLQHDTVCVDRPRLLSKAHQCSLPEACRQCLLLSISCQARGRLMQVADLQSHYLPRSQSVAP